MKGMELLLSISIGIGLSSACGFRVFIPLLVMSIASLSGHLALSSGFAWIGTTPALIAFATAAALEITGYYIPWVDNLLDTVATPASIIAGTIVMASGITDISPFLKWSLAIIAGGGMAALFQGTTALLRGKSSIITGGSGNFAVATAELGFSSVLSILSIAIPFFAGILCVVIAIFLVGRIFSSRKAEAR